MMTPDERRARERQNVMQAINWLDKAIYALDRADYNAAHHAIGVARLRIDEAEVLQDARQD